jgi:hypothetical protein
MPEATFAKKLNRTETTMNESAFRLFTSRASKKTSDFGFLFAVRLIVQAARNFECRFVVHIISLVSVPGRAALGFLSESIPASATTSAPDY